MSGDPQPVQYYIDQLRQRRENFIYLTALQAASDVVGNDDEPEKHLHLRRILHEALVQAKTETSATRDTDLVTGTEEIIQRLADRRERPGHLRGLPTGFDGIDYVTGGLQPEQFVIITGVPKSGKSSFLLYMAKHIHSIGKMPLYIGFEMSNQEQEDRLVSLISGVSLTKIMNGTTTRKEFWKVQQALRRLKGMNSFVLSADVTSTTTVGNLQAKIADYQPDVLFVDGIYMMESDRLDPRQYPKGSPQVLTDISRSLKQLAQGARIPIVVTTQSLVARAKGGLTLSSIGYTSAFGQDADLILGVERQPDSNLSKFHVMESRSGPRKDVMVEWDWDTGTVTEIDLSMWAPPARAAAAKGNFGGNP
ncbi:MAG: hypothetical protein EBR40_11565 [Proteobacteria bacterium]|nr:hypothetical protein [Pseudomonadota bacterium]